MKPKRIFELFEDQTSALMFLDLLMTRFEIDEFSFTQADLEALAGDQSDDEYEERFVGVMSDDGTTVTVKKLPRDPLRPDKMSVMSPEEDFVGHAFVSKNTLKKIEEGVQHVDIHLRTHVDWEDLEVGEVAATQAVIKIVADVLPRYIDGAPAGYYLVLADEDALSTFSKLEGRWEA